MERVRITRALCSVSDKNGIVELASCLQRHGVEILSTGGTARTLAHADVEVTPVEDYTGFPEILHGRVKTLHPRIHGGLLYRRDDPSHEQQCRTHGIVPIDLVVVNLYPFEKTVAAPDVTTGDAIENIDIGGPTMIRSAAKNHAHVTVVVDPSDYKEIMDQMDAQQGIDADLRKRCAVKAFAHTSTYDRGIVSFFSARYDVAL